MEKNPAALDTRGGAACYNRDTSSLVWFQAQPIWEMSDEGSQSYLTFARIALDELLEPTRR